MASRTIDDERGPGRARGIRRFLWGDPLTRSSGQQIERMVTRNAGALSGAGVALAVAFVVSGSDARTVAVALGTFLAASLIGGFAGFLFGLPRDAQRQAGASELHFLVNSNLLKVSDFVTTTIVGLTLTQIGNVVPALTRLADSLEGPLGDRAQSSAFGLVLVLSGFVGGAILSYLWTTVRLREHLELSEKELRDIIRSNSALRTTMQHISDNEPDLDAVRLSLAELSLADLQALRARIPALDDTGDRGQRRKSVLDEITALEGRRKNARRERVEAAESASALDE